MNKRRIIVLTVIIVLAGMLFYAGNLFAQTIYWGKSGSDVRQVQTKLKAWGYYDGPVDGYYGASTFNAMKKFQAKNGLLADGIVGTRTWQALGFSTPPGDTGAAPGGAARPGTNYTPSRGVSAREDVMLLARVVNGEAEAEPYNGKVAVAAVILNRVESDQFPNSLAGVIYQPHAFESITNGVANRTPTADSIKAAQDAINGWDPTYGCIFFWNPSKPVSKWIWSRQITTRIGAHVFAK